MTVNSKLIVFFHWLLLPITFPVTTTYAQSAFLTSVNNQGRSYLITQSHGSSPNQPLVIILHPNNSSAQLSFRKESLWKSLRLPATIAFPLAVSGNWNCNEGMETENDILFLKKIIDESHNNFLIDRNSVFIIGEEDSYCLAEEFKKKYNRLVTAIVRNNHATDVTVINKGDSLTNLKEIVLPEFELWQKPVAPGRNDTKEREDSIKLTKWDNRTVIEIRAGGFKMLNQVKTGIDDKTYMDISDAHQLLDLNISKWMSDSIAWFSNIAWLKVPQKQEVKFTYQGTGVLLKGEGGGGAVVPITAGLKYALHKYTLRPHFLLGTGPMIVVVAGGKFRTTSTNLDPSAVRNNIESEVRTVLHMMLGTGCEWRLAKRIMAGGHLQYIHSAQFESAGQVNAIRGFSAQIGLGFICGANRLN
jgi:hypothetical protein